MSASVKPFLPGPESADRFTDDDRKLAEWMVERISEVQKPARPPKVPKWVDSIRLMREQRVGSLPVLSKGKLAGIITERDLIDVSAQLLEEHLRAAFGDPGESGV